jgi:hypothetical protein
VAEIVELAHQLARWTICTESQKIRNLAEIIKRGKLRASQALKKSCNKKEKDKNIQQRGFAGGHPPNY